MTKEQVVEISQAKGRPMLHWVGKRPLSYVTAFPAQLIETFNPTNENNDAQGQLLHGDNKDILAWLISNGYRNKVDLIYIDPPFNTGVDYVRKVSPRGVRTEKIRGEEYSFTEQIQYTNAWHIDAYLQFLYERLQIAKEVLADSGMIFIRMDVHHGHYLALIAEEVFSQNLYQNEIIVNRIKKNVTDKGRRTIPNAVDHLYVYFKSLEDTEYNDVLRELPETRPGHWHAMDSQGVPGPRELTFEEKTYYPPPGRHFMYPQESATEMWDEKFIRENPRTGKLEYWIKDKDFENLDTDWTDIPGYSFKTGYPTENSEQLLERVIKVGSKPGDIVLDFFVGSGTTPAVAQKLGRRWIAADINKGAVQTTSRRIQSIIQDQIKSGAKIQQPAMGFIDEEDKNPLPAALSFNVFQVNDYDLQIQHNEAVNLAVEHIGIEQTKTDSYFDGTLGNRLAKITPFNHPLTLLDLQVLKDEVGQRKDERDIVVVCLGKETVIDHWIEEYNKKRPINKISVIELRSDNKYGKFFIHQPATAQVDFKLHDDKIQININDFISPTIVERFEMDTPLFKANITDWRSMVDCIMVDMNYDGKVFNIQMSDVPAGKNNLVVGNYELPISVKGATIAVKIIDMLGEEVIVTKDLKDT